MPELAQTHVEFADAAIPKAALWLAAAYTLMARMSDLYMGANLPIPLDYAQHASSASGSFVASSFIAYGTAKAAAYFNRAPRQVRIVSVAVGTLALTAANLALETRTGVRITGLENVADWKDLALGIAGGFVGSWMPGVHEATPDPSSAPEIRLPGSGLTETPDG